MGKMDFWRSGRGAVAAFDPPPRLPMGGALSLMHSFEESGRGWFWATDDSGRLTYLSTSISDALEMAWQAGGVSLIDHFLSAEEDETGRGKLPFALAKQAPFDDIIVQASTLGDERCWSLSGRPQFDRAGAFLGFHGSGLDVTEHRKSSHHASRLAKYDPLTGLPNRRSMSASLNASLSRQSALPCTVMLIDLDRFKQVNDTLGHPAGDALLKQVAERLLTLVKDREQVFRLGGDEFQIILCGTADRGITGDLATRIIATLSQPYNVNGQRCSIGASVGIAAAPSDAATAEELIRNADLALYASKSGGRGRFRFFSGDLLEAAEDRRLLEQDLQDALEKDQIHLEYQPVVETRSNKVKGVEALMRWRHPERGSISPAIFIPIAEETNLIGKLGEWALRKACADVSQWPGKLRVAVNVSPLQFTDPSFAGLVASVLEQSGLDPDQLELEITEGVFLTDSAETDTMFEQLKALGVRLALDDFGTGYSSLSYLRTAPFDKIKIDQTFVKEATLPGCRNSAIISAIVALADVLGMETTAEGIEFMDQLELIRSLGVSHVQGYVYSKAIGNDDVRGRLEAGSWAIEPAGPAKQRSERQAMYRKVAVMHGSRYEPVILRNLSESGALVEGISDAQPGTLCIVDFGDGQLSFAKVTRMTGRQCGIAFEQMLVNDGEGGLCTPHRVSPYMLAAMNVPNLDRIDRAAIVPPDLLPVEALGQRLGLKLAMAPQPALLAVGDLPTGPVDSGAARMLGSLSGAGEGYGRFSGLTILEAERLIQAACASHNRQLRYIVGLIMLTQVRPSELFRAQWSDIDVEGSVWHIPISRAGHARDIVLTPIGIELLQLLPRWEQCSHVIANPATRKPYRSMSRSWEAVRAKAGLVYVELGDLCYVQLQDDADARELLALLR
ncbi:MAG TPA: EAL domain-containing protein [Allosphingosinicella sp.]